MNFNCAILASLITLLIAACTTSQNTQPGSVKLLQKEQQQENKNEWRGHMGRL
jgi:outer membrane biogenesis lipoprotein LolB